MGQVDCCVTEDIPAIAGIHMKVFANADDEPSEALKSYYETVFFHNPWRHDDFPSFVYRSDEGKVVGFVGVIPRPMNFNGKAIRAAVAHRLMVTPDSKSPLAAMKLVKRFLSGPQDFTLADGANEAGRKFWEGVGGRTSYLYSMNWLRPLRPCSYARKRLERKRVLRPVAVALVPGCRLADSILSKIRHYPFCVPPIDDCTAAKVDNQSLLSCISEFSSKRLLRPEYDSKTVTWLLDFLRSNTQRGRLHGFETRNAKGEIIGVCLYYLNSESAAEVMLFLAREDSTGIAFRHLLHHARDRGATCVYGRLEPKCLNGLWDNNCLIKRGSWAIVHARDPELLNVINRGDAMLSALEGELWLRSPNDRL